MNALSAPATVLVIVLILLLAALLVVAFSALIPPRHRMVGGGSASERGEISFPYWAKSLPSAKKMFAALKACPLEARAERGGASSAARPSAARSSAARSSAARGAAPVLVRTYPGDYRCSDALSNHFTEDPRLDCRSGKAATPREAWEAMLRGQDLEGKTPEELREMVYGATRECNIFNPAFVRWVVEKTCGAGAKILDPSSGWGDRLIGALAAGASSYQGFDPNPRLQEGYRRIVDELGGGKHDLFRVTEAPFEDAAVSPRSADLVFTSPPYFAYEEYVLPGGAGEGAQSIGRHPDYESWVEKMYRPYLANAYAAARPGGWIVLYIEDIFLDGRKYPLRGLTAQVMRELGAEEAGRFGLQVVPGEASACDARESGLDHGVEGGGRGQVRRARGKRGPLPRGNTPRPPRVRWALAWRRPAVK